MARPLRLLTSLLFFGLVAHPAAAAKIVVRGEASSSLAADHSLCIAKNPKAATPISERLSAYLEQAGYQVATAGQKAYNGVAILSRTALEAAQGGFPGDPDPSQALLPHVTTIHHRRYIIKFTNLPIGSHTICATH